MYDLSDLINDDGTLTESAEEFLGSLDSNGEFV
jgi:hypothetical protein